MQQSNLNGNLLCAIDIETTGRLYTKNDIIQLCVMPVGLDLKPSKHYNFFHCYIKPRRMENLDKDMPEDMKARVVEAINHGMEPDTAEERLREWFHSLKLPFKKLIVPLGHNYGSFDRDFIQDWLGGPLSYAEFFRSDHRDTMQMALMINDMANWHEEQVPFPKVAMNWLCNRLSIEQPNAHDAVGDCLTTIEVFRKLLRYRDFCPSVPAVDQTPGT